MAKFYYICRDKNGNKKTGIEEALGQDEAINKLQADGLIVVSVIQENTEAANKDLEVEKSNIYIQ